MPASPENVVRAFVAAINAESFSEIRSLMTEDHTFTDGRGNSFSGAEKMLLGWKHFFGAYPGYCISIRDLLVKGNHVALFGEASGKWQVDGVVLSQTWKVSAAWLAEVEADKVKNWSVFCDTGWVDPPR